MDLSIRSVLFVALCGFSALTSSAAAAAAEPTKGDGCPNGSSSIGPIELSTQNEPGTWWYITNNGFVAAGYETDQEQIDLYNAQTGSNVTTIGELAQVIVGGVEPVDKNSDGVVCAGHPTGSPAPYERLDPNWDLYFFKVQDNHA